MGWNKLALLWQCHKNTFHISLIKLLSQPLTGTTIEVSMGFPLFFFFLLLNKKTFFCQCYKYNIGVYLSCTCLILSTNKGGQINFGVRCHEPNRAFLVPDLCRATEKNGNSISTDVTGSTQEHHERLCSTHDISERTSVV